MNDITFNPIAIIAAGLASVVLGGLYVAVFGKQWASLNGYTADQVARIRKKGGPKGFIGITLANLAMALGIAYLVSALNAAGWHDALTLTFWVFVGFVGPLTIAPVLWEGKPIKLWVFNNIINVTCVFVMALILVLWR